MEFLTGIQRFCLTFIFSISSFLAISQNDNSGRIPLNLKASYNSSLIYPGARFGAEFQVLTFDTTYIKESGKKKNFVKDRFVSANFSWYHHPYYHDNLYLTFGWANRRTKSGGLFTEFSPEIGLSRTFIGGTTYKVDNEGNVSLERSAGYLYALISVGGGVGYDFSKSKFKPIMVFYKLNLILMFPYNSTIYLRPAMELGIIYKIQGLHLSKTKHHNK